MGIKKNADASYNLGLGVSDANDYKGFAGQNEITIQLTADGATAKSMDALNYLKTFAINQAAAGLPIKPSASVSISANGYTKALEADDFEITETGVKIGGIEYTTSTNSWDFTNALVPSGGGGSDVFEIYFEVYWDEEIEGRLVVTCNKTIAEINSAVAAGNYITSKALFFETNPYINAYAIDIEVGSGYDIYSIYFSYPDTEHNQLIYSLLYYNPTSQEWQATPHIYSLTPAT